MLIGIRVDATGELLDDIISQNVFHGGKRNQVMIFPSASSSSSSLRSKRWSSSSEDYISKATNAASLALRDKLPEEIWRLLFDEHYHPSHRTVGGRKDGNEKGPDTIRLEVGGRERRRHLRRRPRRPPRLRQTILNLYPPPLLPSSPPSPSSSPAHLLSSKTTSLSPDSHPAGDITPHIDLPDRYGDGIVGVCLLGGVVMDFSLPPSTSSSSSQSTTFGRPVSTAIETERPEETEVSEETRSRREEKRRYSVYMPRRTIYVLTGEARWKWMHGIEGRGWDVVYDDHEDEELDGNGAEDEGGEFGQEEELKDEGMDIEVGEHVKQDDMKEKEDPRQTGSKARIRSMPRLQKPRTTSTILRTTRISITLRWMQEPDDRHWQDCDDDDMNDNEEDDGDIDDDDDHDESEHTQNAKRRNMMERYGGGMLLTEEAGDGDWNVRG